jgi:integrase
MSSVATQALLRYTETATPSPTGKRGPVTRRRFQRGSFIKEANGGMYSVHYIDVEQPDGSFATKQVKRFLGNLGYMSERAARQAHAKTMEEVNHKRGSVAPVRRGQTFADAVAVWRAAIAPNLSPATVRPRESFLRTHILPRFGKAALQDIGVGELQQFATDLRLVLSGKSVVNVLGTVFGVLDYAERCGMRVQKVGFGDLELGSTARQTPVAFFTREQANDIIAASAEPFKTLFSVAWFTGMRAGELLALTRSDLDFGSKTIRVNKSADDNTREIRQPKTKASVALLPMPSALEAALRNYLLHWKPNVRGILFATRNGSRPRSRDNVVRVGLKPVLRKLGIRAENTGLHAFRHGLATELADASVPVPVLQQQMRHADVKTTLRIYSHVIPQTQRDAMEKVGQSLRPIITLRFGQAK